MKKLFYSMMAVAIAASTFTACEDVPEPYNNPYDYVIQNNGNDVPNADPKGSGTTDDPYNVAGLFAACNNLGADELLNNGTDIFVVGYVAQVGKFTEIYGELDYYITDDKEGLSQKFYVYGGLGLNGEKFTSDSDLKLGTKVKVCGKVINFKGNTLEFQYGSKILSMDDSSDDPNPEGDTIGTEQNPITVAEALAEINKLEDGASTSKEAYVKGKISQIKGYYNNSQITYYISDDGQTTNEIQIYNGKNVNGTDFAAQTDLAVGMEVIVKGKLMKYVNKNSGVMTPEMNGGVLVSKNGGGEEPSNDETIGTEKNPITVAEALAEINKLDDGASTSKEAFVKGKISQIKGYYSNSVITYYISDDGQTTNEVQIYNGKNVNGTDFASKDDLAVGMDVVVKGKLMKYVNESGVMTPEINGGVLVSKDGEGNDPGNDPEPSVDGTKAAKSITDNVITLTNTSATESSDVVTVDFNEQGFTNGAAATSVTLSDGTTIAFGKGENTTNAPAFYTATKGVRVYAKNTITINGKAPVAKVVMTCDVYSGTTYIGNDMLYGSINGNQFTIVNDHTEAKGGVQLRVQTMTITYAK